MVILLVALIPVSVVLLITGKKKAALITIGTPIAAIVCSVLGTIFLMVSLSTLAHIHSFRASLFPRSVFRATFGFKPPPQTEVLKAHRYEFLDYATTVIKFKATKDVIDGITADEFVETDRATFMTSYRANEHNLPANVRSWFLQPHEHPDRYYMARSLNGIRLSIGAQAILCYDEESGIAYFHLVDVD
jgi:hypothetical protein